MNEPFFYATFPVGEDQDNVIMAINQGIDSRLEGFTSLDHSWDCINDLYIDIHSAHEFQILIRRLLESGNQSAEFLADDMIMIQYDCEVI